MNAVVTGATSFIGVPVTRRLLQEGHEVVCVVRPGSGNLGRLESLRTYGGSRLHIVEMAMEELYSLDEAVSFSCPWFFHFGWDGSGSKNRRDEAVQQKNVTDSLKALEGAKRLGCERFLFSGSQAEYGLHQEAMTEKTVCLPLSEYGKAKVAFHQEAKKAVAAWHSRKESAMEYLHTRIFSVYGPGDHSWSLVESCLRAFSCGEYLSLGECTQMWNYLYIEDLVDALMALMKMDRSDCLERGETSSVYNIAGRNTETRPLKEYVRTMYELCGFHGSFSYGRRCPNAEGPANLIPDVRKLETETGWRQKTSFEAGIRQMLSVRNSAFA